MVWRSTALLAGVALLSCVLLRPALSWQPVVAYPIVCWLLGTDPQQQVYGWAVLLSRDGRTSASVTSVVAPGAGLVAYLVAPRIRRQA